MCIEREYRINRKLKRREVFKVMKIIEKKIKKEESFTAVDISNKLFDKKYNIKPSRVAHILTTLMKDDEYPELVITKINVVREDGEVVKASLYHLEDADPFDYMDINQPVKVNQVDLNKKEVSFADEPLELDDEDDFDDQDDFDTEIRFDD